MTNTTTASDEALTTAAGKGDEAAFSELHRRHAPLAWRLAAAITGDPDLAARAVANATGTVFTSLRAGRFQTQSHGVALAAATRNAALDLRRDGASTSPAVADDADAVLATTFASLPERWRSVLWLRDAEGLPAEQVAPVVELDPEAADQLAVRARRGLRERYLKAQVGATGPRSCTRAAARLGALEDGTLNDKDAATLERHLRSCPACAERRERVAGLAAALSSLALPVATDLQERSTKAWTAALASSTHTGLSPRTEKILAGASAFAAAAGIIGATFLGGGGDGEPTASPLAPLVADIEAPRPVDLSKLTLPLTTPDPITSTARRSLSPVSSSGGGAAALPGGGTDVAAPAPPAPPSTSGDRGPVAAERPSGPVPTIPVGVDPDEGITVGPINVDTSPGDEPVLDVDLPEPLAPLDPVVEPVTDAVNEVTKPVVEAVEPVTRPVLEATSPVTKPVTDAVNDAVNGVVGGIGLGGL